MKNLMLKMMDRAFDGGVSFIAHEIKKFRPEQESPLRVLDVGIGDGDIAIRIRNQHKRNIHLTGLDLAKKPSTLCDVFVASNLEAGLPFENDQFDVVYSNQVIEHLILKSTFISECRRVLKPGGICIMTTENIASFDNLISLAFGQSPLVQHTSEKIHLNSFLSPHFGRLNSEYDTKELKHLQHKNVMSFFEFQRLLTHEGFRVKSSFGGGHFIPFAGLWLKFQCRVIGFCCTK